MVDVIMPVPESTAEFAVWLGQQDEMGNLGVLRDSREDLLTCAKHMVQLVGRKAVESVVEGDRTRAYKPTDAFKAHVMSMVADHTADEIWAAWK